MYGLQERRKYWEEKNNFEPGCRNNWYIHHAKNGGGQMLICIGGRGYYQEWGKEAVEMTPGKVINIPAEVKHWHGAASDSKERRTVTCRET